MVKYINMSKYTCDICGKTKLIDQEEKRPDGWVLVTVGIGYSNQKDICADCWTEILWKVEALKEAKK